MLVKPNMLPVLYQPHDHLMPKISCWVVRVVPLLFVPDPKGFLDGSEHAATISIDLQIEKKTISY